MMHEQPELKRPYDAEAGQQLAQLRNVLELVEQIAGRPFARRPSDTALDEAAQLSGAYAQAYPIVQARFDALAAETASWAAAGLTALLTAEDENELPKAAAARLADELDKALRDLGRLLSA